MKYVLAVDEGTTSLRCSAVFEDGSIASEARRPVTQHYPAPGMVEHDASEIWLRCREAVWECLSRLDPSECVGIGVTNQRETVVIWDRSTGAPLRNAVVWQDRRTSDLCRGLRDEGFSEEVSSRTGLLLDPYFSATKAAWILDSVEGARGSAEKGDLLFGTIDTWIIWNLTGGRTHATDPTNASRTMLFNIGTQEWDPFLCDLFRVPMGMLPDVLPSSAGFGDSDASVVGISVPVCGVAGDQQSALFGQACFGPGDVKVTLGTGAFLLMNAGSEFRRSSHGLVTSLGASPNGGRCYVLEGSVYAAGTVVKWLIDGLHLISSASETEALATSVEDTAGCVLVPAFSGLGAPYWNPDARGILTGLTAAADRRHIVRAALESIAFQVNDVIESMRLDAGIPVTRVRIDGGVSANNFICQFLADIARIEVVRPACLESTTMGAAFLAGLHAGLWKDAEELSSMARADRVFVPSMSDEDRGRHLERWRRAVALLL